MNDGLIDMFRHNAWASRRLIEALRPLRDDEWQASVEGTYGTIHATMRHYLASEAGYCRRLTGEEPTWDREMPVPFTADDFLRQVDELEERWLRFLSAPFDGERLHVIPWWDTEARDVPSAIVLAQAIHHGSEHRSQIATILTQLGHAAPEWGLWEFAEDTERAPRHVEA